MVGRFSGSATYEWGVTDEADNWVFKRAFDNLEGQCRMSIAFRASTGDACRLVLKITGVEHGTAPRIDDPSLLVQGLGEGRISKVPLAALEIQAETDQTSYLPER